MNEHMTLYSWVREGAAIHLAQVLRSESLPAAPGQEAVTIQMQIQQTLWGVPGDPVRVAQIVQPSSETARLKFPDPLWGRVDLRRRPAILLVTKEPDRLTDPLYVEEIRSAQDPVLAALNEVLVVERMKLAGSQRIPRYLRWLQEGQSVQALFGAEALAKDEDLKEVDKTGQVAQAFAQVFSANSDVYVRLSVGAWMWEEIFTKTNAHGEVAILNATIRGLDGSDEDIRRFSFDRLLAVDAAKLRQPGVARNAAAANVLRRAAQDSPVPSDRAQIKHLLEAIAE
ncbi:MAG: hypothetical protein U1F68_06325 [Gammaproteobacteria bacterium]